MHSGSQARINKPYGVYAWAVQSGDLGVVSAVPLPAAVWLFDSGLLYWVWRGVSANILWARYEHLAIYMQALGVVVHFEKARYLTERIANHFPQLALLRHRRKSG